MNIYSIFMSAFTKQCPHCNGSIKTRHLRKVPRKPVPRWYQTTPAPHRACPLCGGFVISTINNSPWLYAPFVFLVALLILGLYWPAAAVFTNSLLGRLLMLLVVSPLLWLAIKNSKLVCEPPSVLTHHSSGTG